MPQLSSPVDKADHVQGSPDAPVTLVEYGDYQCPDCGVAYPIVKRLQKHFGEKLRFVFRNFPLEMHPYAMVAAETAEFAATEGKFWEAHDLLYEGQSELSEPMLVNLAQRLHISDTALQNAWKSKQVYTRVERDLKSGNDSDVEGTPTFFINGTQWEQSYEYETLAAAIEAQLKQS